MSLELGQVDRISILGPSKPGGRRDMVSYERRPDGAAAGKISLSYVVVPRSIHLLLHVTVQD